MPRTQRDQAVDVGLEVATERFGEREDQVQREILDACVPGRVHGALDRQAVVRAMHPGEDAIVEGLRADRKAIDAALHPLGNRFGGDVFRIRLDCELASRSEGEMALHELDRAADTGPAEPRGRASAQIDRVHLLGRGGTEPSSQLRAKSREVLVDRHASPHRDGEVAVRAAAGAEWDMQVDVAEHCSISHRDDVARRSHATDLTRERALDKAAHLQSTQSGERLVRRKTYATAQRVQIRAAGCQRIP